MFPQEELKLLLEIGTCGIVDPPSFGNSHHQRNELHEGQDAPTIELSLRALTTASGEIQILSFTAFEKNYTAELYADDSLLSDSYAEVEFDTEGKIVSNRPKARALQQIRSCNYKAATNNMEATIFVCDPKGGVHGSIQYEDERIVIKPLPNYDYKKRDSHYRHSVHKRA
jgi:hypothetical protein